MRPLPHGAADCNEIYYRTLRAVRANLVVPHSSRRLRRGLLLPVLFVHLPEAKVVPVEEAAELVSRIVRALLLS